MPFFLKPCFKIRKKKKKAIKKNSSTYFKSFYDKESPVTSAAIHEGASTSFASIDRDERDIGLLTRLVLGSTESQPQNTKVKESRETKNITAVPSPDRDIVDILSSAVEQLSDDNSSSDDNRYGILSSSCRPDEETDIIEFRGLLYESFETSNDQLNNDKENQLPGCFVKEYVEDSVGVESKTHAFIIARKLSKNAFLKDISIAKLEETTEVTYIMQAKKCSVDGIAFANTRHTITEVEHLQPLTIYDCFTEQTVPPVSVNESAEISECKYEEMVCGELGDVSRSESSEINFITSPEENDSESESALNILELRPTVTISDHEFSDTELSLALQKVLSINFCEGHLEKAIQVISSDALKAPFESGHFEITGASDQHNTEGKINPAECIKHSTGDSCLDLLKRENDISENILLNDKVLNETHDTSEIIDKLNSTVLSECCGDHSDNINDTHTKKLTCRMAAAMSINPFNFSTNEMDVDTKIESNSDPCSTVHKRRRSRNALFSSLNIKLSPDVLNTEVNNAEEQCAEEIFEKERIESPNEKSNSSDDVSHQISELKQLCEKIETEGTVAHIFKYKNKPLGTSGNDIGENNNLNLKTMINNLESKDESSFIDSTLNYASPNSKCKNLKDKITAKYIENCSLKHSNYSLASEKVNNSIEITAALEMEILPVIEKILSFTQREVNLFYQNKEFVPKSLKYFIKELLFDYTFYKGLKNKKVSKKQLRFENADKDSIESNKTKTSVGSEADLCYCTVNDPLIGVNESYELSQQEYDINCKNIKSSDVNSDSSDYNRRTSASLANYCMEEILAKEEEVRNILTTDIGSNKENISDDLKTFQCLDKCLAYEEQSKCQNKKMKRNFTFLPTDFNIASKHLPNDINSEIVHNYNENLTCSQITSNCPTVVSPLNDFTHCSFDDISLLEERGKDKLLESPSFSSAGGDIGNKSLCTEAIASYDNKCLKFDAGQESEKSEMLVVPGKTNQAYLQESKDEKNTLSIQDSPNHFTIVLSPRKNRATVNCSVNMTIGGNTSTCSSSLTSPISIEVTREDIRKNERLSIKTRQNGTKSSTEDITENCGLHISHLFRSKELESKRLRNLELYEIHKSEAKKPMGKQTRVIPIHPAESFEFTLSSLDNSVKKLRSAKHSVKSKKHNPHKVLTPYQIKYKDFNPEGVYADSSPTSKISSVHNLDMQQEKNSANEILCRRHDFLKSPIYGTPERSKILTASKAIRSPKYSLKTEASSSKGTRRQNATPHKIDVNNPKLYFLDESSSEYKRDGKSRSQVSDEYNRALNSPFDKYRQHLLCTKLSSPTDLSSKFDHKFKR